MKKYSTKITRTQLVSLVDMINGVFEITQTTDSYEKLLLSVLFDLKKQFESRLVQDIKPEYRFSFAATPALALLTLYRHYDFDISPGSNKLSIMCMDIDQQFHSI